MRRRQFLIGLAALPVGGVVWLAARNRFVVANEAGQPIRWLIVGVCGETFRFADIPLGGSVSATFGTPRDESGFEVHWQLAGGVEFANYCGYVVWEDYGRQFRLTVKQGGEVSCTP